MSGFSIRPGHILRCMDCGNIEEFKCSAKEYHDWIVDQYGDCTTDIGCDEVEQFDDFQCRKCKSMNVKEVEAKRIDTPCPHCGREQGETLKQWYTPCPSDDCPSNNLLEKRTIKARVVFEYDFTDSIQMVEDDRKQDGEPPMTTEEIEDWIREDLIDFNFNETVGDLPLTVTITEGEE